jgi:hypothetical protein
MVVYNLICENEHRFEGWFASLEGYESQANNGMLACPVCGSADVARRPSASYVKASASEGQQDQRQVAMTAQDPRLLWAKMVEFIRRHTEDVGNRFPEEARKIYYKEAEAKNIRGTATTQEIAELRDEGIEIFPLPAGPALPPDKLQ